MHYSMFRLLLSLIDTWFETLHSRNVGAFEETNFKISKESCAAIDVSASVFVHCSHCSWQSWSKIVRGAGNACGLAFLQRLSSRRRSCLDDWMTSNIFACNNECGAKSGHVDHHYCGFFLGARIITKLPSRVQPQK